MYKIQTPAGETYLTEKPNFIRVHSNGCYILTEQSKAEGIAYHGTPYMFAGGAICYEVDAGEDILATERNVADHDAMTVDQEYRLTLLELGV